jgi:predicted ATPase
VAGKLIGRSAELAFIETALSTGADRLLTLVGTGGVGKTRLAVAAATSVRSRFEDGVRFVDLAPLCEHDQVATAVAYALGLREAGPVPAIELLRSHLRKKHLLLVLDNFEHVLPAAAMVARLLAICPRLRILVTSREPFHLGGERQFVVAPLGLLPTAALPPHPAPSDVR